MHIDSWQMSVKRVRGKVSEAPWARPTAIPSWDFLGELLRDSQQLGEGMG